MHESVLLEEAVNSLNLKEDSIVVDMTLGFGGHSSEILKRIKKGRLIAFDQDEEALKYSREKLERIGNNFDIIDSNFVYLKENLEKLNIKKVDAILYDLGVSSPQLDEDYRGFSYHQDAPLDMRMDQDNPLTAATIVNTYSYQDLKLHQVNCLVLIKSLFFQVWYHLFHALENLKFLPHFHYQMD